MWGPMPSAQTSVRTASPPSLVLPICAMFAMAALVVAAALLGLREAAIDMNPNGEPIAAADPWPFGLVTLIGWLLLEQVAPALRDTIARPIVVLGLLLVVRVTLVACLVLVAVGPAAQLLLEALT